MRFIQYSKVNPNIYVLSEAIRSSMENSMELLSATMQRNPLVMANAIREGFAAPSLEGSRDTFSKKRARTSSQVAHDDSSGSSHKRSRNMARETCTAQVVAASPSHSEGDGAAEVVSLLDPSDSFSDPEQPVATPSTLGRWRISRWRRQQGPLFLRLWLSGYATFRKLPCCARS